MIFIDSQTYLFIILKVFKQAPITSEIKDRSFIIPVYSGLFFLLKYHRIVDPSLEMAYENNLVKNFVEETRLNGNPVHYSRSLALQSEFYSRQGQYPDALLCHNQLKKVYKVEKHSALVVEAYGADKSAQNYGTSANSLYRLGRVKEALEMSNFILCDIMPRMDLRNVNNSIKILYPVLLILNNESLSKRAASVLERFVCEPFRLYSNEKENTFLIALLDPLKLLLSIRMYMQGELQKLDSDLISWALKADSLMCPILVDKLLAHYGRCVSSIGAEICLLLFKHTEDQSDRKHLVEKGWKLAQTSMKTAIKCGSHQTIYFETKPIYDELSILHESFTMR